MRKTVLFFLAAVFATFSAAQAHFVFVEALPAKETGKINVRVTFGEDTAHGEAQLVEKIKQTKVTSIGAPAGKSQSPLPL